MGCAISKCGEEGKILNVLYVMWCSLCFGVKIGRLKNGRKKAICKEGTSFKHHFQFQTMKLRLLLVVSGIVP